MKDPTRDSRQIVDRFLGRMAEPVSEEQSERATEDVLQRLGAQGLRVVNFPAAGVAEPRPARANVWAAIAACAFVMLAGGLLHLILQQSSGLEMVAKRVSGEIQIAGTRATFPGHSGIEAGNVLRAGNGGGAIALPDGSQIDMSPDAELSIDREADGLRVRLAVGTVLVTAAKQRNGHLYVETKDCVVSVTGTVFAVSTEESGSRVSVLEGAVQIHRGEISQTLLAGQQATTSPELRPVPPETGLAWASERLAVLQQPPAQQQPQTPNVNAGSTVRGVVKGTNGVGIPDVSVTLCPNFTEVKAAAPRQVGVPFDDTVHVDGPIIKNKTFFFGLFDCAVSTAVTDSMGRFEFSNVAPGEYAARAEREGFSGPAADVSSLTSDGNGVTRYFKAWDSNRQLLGDSMRVTVYAQQASQDISLALVPAGVIAGHVRDGDGKPVVNARVRIVGPPSPGSIRMGPILFTTTTNDLGAYRAFWLMPGEYRVVAEGPRSQTYWVARAATTSEGSLVVLREGEEVSNIDIVLRPGADEPTFPNPRR